MICFILIIFKIPFFQYQVRTQASQVSSSFLSEAVDFGLRWNGTELGQENRLLFAQNDIENLERQKRQLEFGKLIVVLLRLLRCTVILLNES